jgi:Polyketide cyclase / dehydrase and lipid transport
MAVQIDKRLELAASPEQVADLLVDLPRWPEWFALHKGWVGTVPDRAAKGTRFKHRVRFMGVPGDIEWTVTELDFPRHFVLKGKGTSRTGAEITFDVTPDGDGSRIDFVARLSGLALRPFEGIVKPWIEVRAERTVSALREQLAAQR